nr:Chain I, Peptide [Pseudomonas aeruginosa]6U3O_J Chain J, Peptide [Pseudomonas aeruginosa]
AVVQSELPYPEGSGGSIEGR